MIFGGGGDSKLEARVKELEEENQRLREALEFYADPKHWSEGHKYRDADEATIFEDKGQVSAVLDMGATALRALKNK
jgi:hypothetical protein